MPTLDLATLEKQIAARRLGVVHLFVGEDVRLVARILDAVEATIDPADQPFAVERLYAGESGGSPVDIAAAARAYPMLGDRRIVIVLRAERLLKPKRAAKTAEAEDAAEEPNEEAADLAPLEEYVKKPVDSTTLVWVATEIDRSRRLTKLLLDKAEVTEFAGLEASNAGERRDAAAAATAFVQGEIARAGRSMDPASVRLLVERNSGDISRLRGDVERLLLYTEGQTRISREDAAEVVSSAVSDDDWAVVNALAAGDAGRALREAGKRFDRGDSPHALVGQLRWWVSTRLAEADPDRVRPAIEALLRTDLELKRSGGDERVLVERLVVELAGRPLPQGGWGGRR